MKADLSDRDTAAASPTSVNSIPTLLRELRDQTGTLLRQEVELAKSELKASISEVGRSVANIAVGGIVAYAGVIVLLIGLGQVLGVALVHAGMSEDVARWLAPTVLGLIVAVIGASMLMRAKRALGHADLTPHRTIETVQEDKQWITRKIKKETAS